MRNMIKKATRMHMMKVDNGSSSSMREHLSGFRTAIAHAVCSYFKRDFCNIRGKVPGSFRFEVGMSRSFYRSIAVWTSTPV